MTSRNRTETPERDQTERLLRDTFRTMDAGQAQTIREAYYKAVEGLYALAETLELADAQLEHPGGPLIEEHLIACQAIEAMKASLLGRIL